MRDPTESKPFADPIALPVYALLGVVTGLCVLLLLIRIDRLGDPTFRFLLWNLFLAWLPLVVSMFAIRFARLRTGAIRQTGLTVLCLGWLLLFPNAPYLTTDFVHLIFRRYDFESLILWYDLVVFFLFSWCGLLIGYVSMRHFHALIRKERGGGTGWLFVCAASFLSGFGIYLGRVVRLNSWDALFSPFRLIDGVAEGLNRDAFVFTCLFGLFILVLYLSLYVLKHDER